MTYNATFATSIKAALCCGVAILLTACGGAGEETAGLQSLAGMTAGDIIEGTGASVAQPASAPDTAAQEIASAGVPAAPAPAPAPANARLADAATAPATGGSPPASNEFNLNGYQDDPAASPVDAATQGTTAATSADGQQATQLPAA